MKLTNDEARRLAPALFALRSDESSTESAPALNAPGAGRGPFASGHVGQYRLIRLLGSGGVSGGRKLKKAHPQITTSTICSSLWMSLCLGDMA